MDNFDLKKYLAEGKLFEESFKNPLLDKYLSLKKSIDHKTVFPTDLQDFLNSLDNTEREGLKRDLENLNEYGDNGDEYAEIQGAVIRAITGGDQEQFNTLDLEEKLNIIISTAKEKRGFTSSALASAAAHLLQND